MSIFYSYYGRMTQVIIKHDFSAFALSQSTIYLKEKEADEKIAAELRARNHARKQKKNEGDYSLIR